MPHYDECVGSLGGLVRQAPFAACLGVIVALVVVQSTVHLAITLDAGRIDTFVDLDRSNGLPDIVSTIALVAGSAGALMLSRRETGRGLSSSLVASALLGALTLADFLHDGAHPFRRVGPLVIVLAVAALSLLALIGLRSSRRTTVTLAAAAILLAASFLSAGLDRLDHWFVRERGDPITEYQIVAKEGLELLGWSLVALGLWNEALHRRSLTGRTATTARASRARAASRRRAA